MAVDFNKDDIGTLATEKRAAAGKHALLCLEAERHRSDKNSNLMARLVWKIVKDPGDANSVTGFPIQYYLTVPARNSEAEGHKLPDWAKGDFFNLMPALFPEDCPAMPRYSKEDKCYYFNGSPIEREEVQAYKEQAVEKALNKIKKIWGKEGDGIGEAFAGQLIFADVQYSNGSNFPKFKYASPECPEDWTLSDVYVEGGKSNGVRGKETSTSPKRKSSRRRKRG